MEHKPSIEFDPARDAAARAAYRNHDGRMASVRRFYGVPAYRGREVIFSGLKFSIRATIVSSTGSHLYLRAANGVRIGPCHPTWAMDYGDGRDYGAETNERIRQFNAAIARSYKSNTAATTAMNTSTSASTQRE